MKISTLARKNARQSVNIILMITLASMLICTVTNLGFTIQKQFVDNIIEFTGDYQVIFSDLTEEQVTLVSQRKETALADLHYFLWGFGFEDLDSYNHIRLTYSTDFWHSANFTLTSGRVPEAADEAVIPPHLAELLGIEPKVGEEFEIYFIEWNSDGTLTGREPIKMRFVVSGMLSEQRTNAASNNYGMFVSKAFAEQVKYERELYLRFRFGYNPYQTARNIAGDIGLNENSIHFNEMYLTANLNDPTIIIFVFAVLLILAAAGALVIYNAYNISVVKKVHQYGLLTVIGASKKQIRRSVYMEALYCAGIGLLIGLLAGTLVGYTIISALSGLAFYPTPYALNPLAYLLSAAVTFIMVYVGVRRPARKASHIAPVEAVRFADVYEKTSKRAPLENVTLNLLARINLSRARGRTVGTVLSLSISGILFLGFSTVAFSMRDSAGGMAGQSVYGDIQLTAGRFGVTQKNPDPLTRELVNTIRGLDGVKQITTLMRQQLLESVTDANGGYIPEDRSEACGLEADALQGIIDQAYDGEVTLADFNDPRNVIAVIPSDNMIDYFNRLNGIDYAKILARHSVGSRLEYSISGPDGWFPNETVSIRIIGLVHEKDIRRLYYAYNVYPLLYTLQDSFKSLGWDEYYERVILDVEDAKHDNVLLAIEQICGQDTDINIESFKQMKEEITQRITAIIAVVLLLLGVVALNGVMNLIGSTVMGIEQRKKELGVLMAIGLSRKAVGKMLAREGLWVSLFCSALSVVFGLGLGIGLYQLLIYTGADYMHFVFPAWPLVSLCAVLGFVPYTVTLLASRGLQRATIVELLGRWV